MGHNQGPVDGRHKKIRQQYDSNNKKASSNQPLLPNVALLTQYLLLNKNLVKF